MKGKKKFMLSEDEIFNVLLGLSLIIFQSEDEKEITECRRLFNKLMGEL